MTDTYERFLEVVQLKAGLPRPEAERAAQVTLQTLAERISKGDAHDLAMQLPPRLAPWVATDGGPEAFDVDEFVRRVAERERADPAAAERHARAVFDALGRIVSREEIDDLASALPHDFLPLIDEARGRFVHLVPADEFWRRVAERTGLDAGGARRATEAVLTTLAERIAGGEVEDLIGLLPGELHAPLRAGNETSHGAATPMSLDEFLQRVAEREGVAPAAAREHARAVFSTLREAVGEAEFLDVSSQLPVEYAAVRAHPHHAR